MKFRTLLLASAAVLVAAPAFAGEDITAAFYTPAKGKFLSSTSVETSRVKEEGIFAKWRREGWVASEELTYGVTDNLAVFGSITNAFKPELKTWDRTGTHKGRLYNNDHNFAYELGAKYNMNYGKVLGQVALSYQTLDPRSWWGKDMEDDAYQTNKWEKVINGEVKLGYALDCGLTPYTTFAVSDDVTHSAKDKKYSWFLGAHKMLDNTSWDLGVRYDFNSDRPDSDDKLYLQAEANYFVKENVTVGVFGDYYIGGENRKDKDEYSVGLNAKVAF